MEDGVPFGTSETKHPFFQKQFNMKHTVDDIELKIEPEFRMLHNRVGVFNTHFQNFGHYNIPKAQLILADPPYNLGVNAYASNPSW